MGDVGDEVLAHLLQPAHRGDIVEHEDGAGLIFSLAAGDRGFDPQGPPARGGGHFPAAVFSGLQNPRDQLVELMVPDHFPVSPTPCLGSLHHEHLLEGGINL